MTGIVFDIKRYAVHDGPGIRTTVFLKGCPLRCLWCHNPESFLPKVETFLSAEKIGNKTLHRKKNIGEEYTPQQLFAEIEKDVLFFDESKGGVSFSGGEPLMQVDFLQQMLRICRQNYIHTVVDTSGYAPFGSFQKIVDYTNLFLFDLKQMNAKKHRQVTGVSNEIILNNLDYLLRNKKDVIIRYPIIPTYNDSAENIAAMIKFLNQYDYQPEIHILPYHKIGRDKYNRFGKTNKIANINSLKVSECKWAEQKFKEAGYKVSIGG